MYLFWISSPLCQLKWFLFVQDESSNNAKFLLQTLEASKTVLNLSSNKRFNVDILDKVMALLEEQPPHFVDSHEASDGANKETRQSNQLLDIIGDILQQVTNLSGHFILYLYTILRFISFGCACRLCEVEAAMRTYGVCMRDGTRPRVTCWHVLKLC